MPGVWEPYRKMLPYLLEQAPVDSFSVIKDILDVVAMA